jgi:UDP-N-acetylmuramate--alanine ligase
MLAIAGAKYYNVAKRRQFMYQIDFNRPAHVHFLGIGGISMSGLAKLLLLKGFTVSGSDDNDSDLVEELKAKGARVNLGLKAENITDDIDVVIYTGSIHPDNPEFREVRRRGLPELSRGQLMGELMRNYPHAVGISGTDGKTTTTALLSMILLDAGYDPTISVGGIVPGINSNFRTGNSPYFVVESCEYTNSFLDFFPTDAVVLNIREDHLDFFKDLDDIRNSFRRFGALVPAGGLLVINGEIPSHDRLFSRLNATVKTYGLKEDDKTGICSFDYVAANISYDEKGRGNYDLYEKGQLLGRVSLGLVGRHNVSNSLAAIAVARKYGVPFSSMVKTLKEFTGAKRRFEYKGLFNGAELYDDYAHNPDEITATLTAAKNHPHKRLITVFQPHTYSRTKALLHEFVKALSMSDVVIMADIYAAREIDDGTISSKDVRDLLEKNGKEAYYFSTFGEIENFLSKFSSTGDLLITMGAGDIVNVGDELLRS